jgi:hypothetical protein
MTPELPALRAAVAALDIPISDAGHGLAGMTEERQRTVLLALLVSYSLGHLNNHAIAVDPLTPEERYRLHVSATADMTDGDAGGALSLMLLQVLWARDVVAEVGTNAGDASLLPAVTDLLMAAMALLDVSAVAQREDGFVLDDQVYHTVKDAPYDMVGHHIAGAVAHLASLAGPQSGT